MSRRRKLGLTAGVVLTVLVLPVLLLVTAPMLYSGLVNWAVRATFGLDLQYQDMDVTLLPLHVSVSGVVLRNPDPAFAEPLLTARRASATAQVGAYLDSAPTWWRAAAEGVEVHLVEDARGRSNWPTSTNGPQQETARPGPLLEFSRAEVVDLRVLRVAAESHRFDFDRLYLEQAEDERLRIEASGSYRDQRLDASGTLALPTSERARQVSFDATVFGGTVKVDGLVGHDGITPGKVSLSADFQDLSALSVLLGIELNALAPVVVDGTLNAPKPGVWLLDTVGEVTGRALRLHANVVVAEQQYRLRSAALEFGDSALQASGALDTESQRVQATVDAARLTVDEWLTLAAVGGPGGGSAGDPASASSLQIRVPPQLHPWSFDLTLAVQQAAYRDQRLRDLAVALHDEPEGLVLSGSLGGFATGAAGSDGWRLVKPVEFTGRLTVPHAGTMVTGTEVNLSTDGIRARTRLIMPAAEDKPPHAELSGHWTSLAAIEGLGYPAEVLADLYPIEWDVTVQQGDTGWEMALNTLKLAGGQMNGELTVDSSSEPIAVRGRLSSPELSLNTIPTTAAITSGQPAPDSGSTIAGGADAEEQSPPDAGLISDEPLSWSWLRAATVDLEANVGLLAFNQSRFRDVRTRVRLQDGSLEVAPVHANLSRGGIRGHLNVTGREQGARVDTRLVVSQLTPADLGQPEQGFIDGGATDLVVDLRAEGLSLQDLASTLNGQVALEVQRATIRNNLFEMLTSDALVQTLRAINPFIDQDPQTELECAAAHVVASNGLLSSPNRLVLETSKVVIRAGGQVNLQDETLTIDFIPSPREGLGISVGGLAELVRLGGTLGDIEIQADPSAILKGGATIGAAIATGGLSLLAQGLFARARNAGTSCGSIFEEQTDVPEAIQVNDQSDDTDASR